MRILISSLVSICLLIGSWQVRAQDSSAEWSAVVGKAVQSVVSLQISYVRDFVEADQGVSSATGFVVDAEQGIILTNRHVIGAGPVAITATFQNLERVDVVPLYRDPVHDFGFLRYDPADLRRNNPASLKLNPAGATVGTDVRVIGSDGGEQLSILAGTIARVDRRAPNYGRYGHNDFNTFYLQAASSTSGGSSGSPVLDQFGDVIALNAAANSSTASSFFLPLDRIKYALEKLQAKEPVARGTVQTVFEQRPFRFLSRLGLHNEIAQRIQQDFPLSNGMLLVRQVFVGGVAEGVLLEGDIVVGINGQTVTEFIRLAQILDSSIGTEVEFKLIRQGATVVERLTVQDLEALQPTRLVELGGSVFHNVSVQRARGMNLPQRGVVVAKSGYEFARAGVPRDALITELNGRPINTVNDLLDHMHQASGNTEWRLRFVEPGREFTSAVARVEVNARWFGAKSCDQRNDSRFWDCTDVELPGRRSAPEVLTDVVLPGYKDAQIQKVAPSLVRLSFDIPYAIDNVYATSFSGVGLVVDAERGLVVTDRNTVPIELGDLELTFFSTYKIPGRVAFLHPLHNIAVLQYDPALLGDVTIEPLPMADSFPALDNPLELIGYRNDGTIRKQNVPNPSEVTLYFNLPQLSRFQQVPIDVLSAALPGPTLGGPLVDQNGVVQALWQSFAYQSGDEVKEAEWAMPAAMVKEVVNQYLSEQALFTAPAVFQYKSLALAREQGLTDQWIARIVDSGVEHRRVLAVSQVVGDSAFKVGDILLDVNGQLPSTLAKLEKLFQLEQVNVRVLRDGGEIVIGIDTIKHEKKGTRRALLWAGSIIQEPHFELSYQRGNVTAGLFISGTQAGSPSIQDRLYRNRFIVAVEGVPTSTIDEFIAEISSKNPTEPVRLTVVAMNGYRSVVSVQPEYNFWPTTELRRTDRGWQRKSLPPAAIAVVE